MEIIINNISLDINNNKILDKVSVNFKKTIITGVTGIGKTKLLELIDYLYNPSYGSIKIGNLDYNDNNKNKIRKLVGLVPQNIDKHILNNTMMEEISLLMKQKNYNIDNFEKRIKTSLSIVGLSDRCLNQNIVELSSGEQKLLQIAMVLFTNPKVILLDEPFINLDFNNKKKIIKIIRELKIKYNRTIIISSSDTNLLYELTDNVLILNNRKKYLFGDTKEIFKKIEKLNKIKLDIPNLVLFVEKVKSKYVKLMYHKDIKDLIKDIYKHV